MVRWPTGENTVSFLLERGRLEVSRATVDGAAGLLESERLDLFDG